MTLVPSAVDPDVSASLQIYERLKPLKDALGVQNLTDNELQLFAIVARHTGLDPFTKQIYAIKRGGRVTHQTGIDGYRSVAERTRQYAGSDEATYEECGCGQAESPPQHPSVARVVVHRTLEGGQIVDQAGVARWHELKPNHVKPNGANDFLDSMWWRQPYNQLAKCAEANGLRKAFPRVLGGVYIRDEMQVLGETVEGHATEVSAPTPPPPVRERVAARRAAAEAQKPATTPADAQDVAQNDDVAWIDGEVTEVAAGAATGPTTFLELRELIRARGARGPDIRTALNTVLADKAPSLEELPDAELTVDEWRALGKALEETLTAA